MTFKACKDMVAARIRDTSSDTDTRIGEFANDVMAAILRRTGFSGQVREGTIRTTPNRMTYALKPDVRQIIGDMRHVSEIVPVVQMEPSEYDGRVVTGRPFSFFLDGRYGVETQPHSYIRLVSDGTDTRTVTIYGKSYGVWTSEVVTLTSTTAVLTANAYQELGSAPTASETSTTCTITATANSTSAQTSYPTVAQAGNLTLFTIAPNATIPTAYINPGSLVRLNMLADVAGDRYVADVSGTVVIEGYAVQAASLLDRYLIREVLNLDNANSTTVVVSTNSFSDILSITKTWNATSTLIVKVDNLDVSNLSAGAAIVAAIPPVERSLRFPYCSLYPIPDSTDLITYRYHAHWHKLFNAGDEPPLESWHEGVWADWTWRLTKAWKDGEPGTINLSSDPSFLNDVDTIFQNQKPAARRLAMGSGVSMIDRGSPPFGLLPGNRFRNG